LGFCRAFSGTNGDGAILGLCRGLLWYKMVMGILWDAAGGFYDTKQLAKELQRISAESTNLEDLYDGLFSGRLHAQVPPPPKRSENLSCHMYNLPVTPPPKLKNLSRHFYNLAVRMNLSQIIIIIFLKNETNTSNRQKRGSISRKFLQVHGCDEELFGCAVWRSGCGGRVTTWVSGGSGGLPGE
jgi:hypothetical protein